MRWLDGIINSMDMSLSKFPGDSKGQRSLVCCSPWECKQSDTTEQLNNKNDKMQKQWVNYFLISEMLSEMNYNFSSVELSKHFNCPYSAVKKVEEMVLSHVTFQKFKTYAHFKL